MANLCESLRNENPRLIQFQYFTILPTIKVQKLSTHDNKYGAKSKSQQEAENLNSYNMLQTKVGAKNC